MEAELKACGGTVDTVLTRLVLISTRCGLIAFTPEDKKNRKGRVFFEPSMELPDRQSAFYVARINSLKKRGSQVATVNLLVGTLPPPNAVYAPAGLAHLNVLRAKNKLAAKEAEKKVRELILGATEELTRDRLWTDLFTQRNRPYTFQEMTSLVEKLRKLVVVVRVDGPQGVDPRMTLPTMDRDGASMSDFLDWLEDRSQLFQVIRCAPSPGAPVAFILGRNGHLALIELHLPSPQSDPELYVWSKTTKPKYESAAIDSIYSLFNVLCLYLWQLSDNVKKSSNSLSRLHVLTPGFQKKHS